MKKIIQMAAILGVGVGVFGLSGVTASANSQYSAKRSNSVRLVWRKSMKRHAFTATQGARYSKHLGIRYSNNDVTPSVTWYTDAHEKLYKKYKGHNAIYYHVKSADGTLQGWIWRGYLKAPKNTNASKPANTSNNTTDADPQAVDSKALSQSLFPNSKYDQELSDQANTYFAISDTNAAVTRSQTEMNYYLSSAGLSFKKMKYIYFESKDPTSLKSIDQAVTAQGYDATARASLKGWSVGGVVTGLDEFGEGWNGGDGLIFLIQ